MKRYLVPLLAVAVAAGLALSIQRVFYVADLEAQQLYWNQKIFYFHVPFAIMQFAAVIGCGLAALGYLITRKRSWDDIAVSLGEIAVLFGAIMLITGMVWGRAAWGVWWQWEMRLTTALLLWLLMVGYVLVRRFGGGSAEALSAGLAVFAMVDVPLVYFSVKYWNFLHPKAEVASSLGGNMATTFRLTSFTIMGLFVLLALVRVVQARGARELRELRERGLDAGILEP